MSPAPKVTPQVVLRPLPVDGAPAWRGSRITLEEIPPQEMQRLAEPGLPMRIVVSGVIHDPTGEEPPPLLELRVNWAMLAELKSQIHSIQMTRFAQTARKPAATAEPPPPEEAVVLPLTDRRVPGAWLTATLSRDQINERRGTWTAPPTEAMTHLRDGLLRSGAASA